MPAAGHGAGRVEGLGAPTTRVLGPPRCQGNGQGSEMSEEFYLRSREVRRIFSKDAVPGPRGPWGVPRGPPVAPKGSFCWMVFGPNFGPQKAKLDENSTPVKLSASSIFLEGSRGRFVFDALEKTTPQTAPFPRKTRFMYPQSVPLGS